MVNVEPYGGLLHHTWFDRDLTVAGRVLLRQEGGAMTHKLVGARFWLDDVWEGVGRVAAAPGGRHGVHKLVTGMVPASVSAHLLGACLASLAPPRLPTPLHPPNSASNHPHPHSPPSDCR